MEQAALINDIPSEESDRWEFKSSLVKVDELAVKIGRAASGFWNSGGGNFAAGVGPDGKVDGGIPSHIGRQDIRDWLDRAIARVTPPGPYTIDVLPTGDSGNDRVVAIVRFAESRAAPHMGPDHRYYVRVGAHTEPATQYIVEALWSRRRHAAPVLSHAFVLKPSNPDIVQLLIVPLTDLPALDVQITLEPLPNIWKDAPGVFPIKIPLISREVPFHMDVTTWHMAKDRFGECNLTVHYRDLSGASFVHEAKVSADRALTPYRMGDNILRDRLNVLKKISDELRELRRDLLDARDEDLKRRWHRYRYPQYRK